MQQSKTQKGLLSIFEKFIRRNVILYYFVRNIVIYFNIFEEDFNILKRYYHQKAINIIDIGASDGIATNFFLKNLKVKKIFCYEPQKIFIKKLKKLKKKNRNIIIKEFGISDKEIKETIYYPFLKIFGREMPLLTYAFYRKKELIDQMKLDFNNYKEIKIKKTSISLKKFRLIKEKIDLIKIDINGLELQIVKSLMSQIKKDKPMLIIENNTSLNEINKILKKYNYNRYYNQNLKLIPHKNQNALDLFFIPEKN
ncbi:FkbM family methyltransferase [Candidatus Pelagibacter sp.]|uniref:FkbM family methyltransferase n=1 Tax=Candidatus Pelagibacter sp. TaxID=2024849 RepID=UPI003F83F125